VQCLTNANAWLRVSSVQAINFMHGAEEAVPSLVTCLTDPEPAVRSTAAIALGDMRKQPETVVPRLIVLLDDAESSVRQAATIALGLYGSPAEAAAGKLALMQNDPSGEVRRAAENAMERILPKEAERATDD
jgi:HEAT repeat protein